MDGVAVASASGGVNLEAATAVSTEVVEVGGVSPVGVDGGVVVESALHTKIVSNGMQNYGMDINIHVLTLIDIKYTTQIEKTYNAGGEADRGVEVVAEVGVDVVGGDVGGT